MNPINIPLKRSDEGFECPSPKRNKVESSTDVFPMEIEPALSGSILANHSMTRDIENLINELQDIETLMAESQALITLIKQNSYKERGNLLNTVEDKLAQFGQIIKANKLGASILSGCKNYPYTLEEEFQELSFYKTWIQLEQQIHLNHENWSKETHEGEWIDALADEFQLNLYQKNRDKQGFLDFAMSLPDDKITLPFISAWTSLSKIRKTVFDSEDMMSIITPFLKRKDCKQLRLTSHAMRQALKGTLKGLVETDQATKTETLSFIKNNGGSLKKLSFCQNRYSIGEMKEMIARCSNLQTLSISFDTITRKVLQEAQGLLDEGSLRLKNLKIDSCLFAVAPALGRFKELETLYIEEQIEALKKFDEQIGDDYIKTAFEQIPFEKLSSLTSYTLSSSEFCSYKRIADLHPCKALKEIIFLNNDMYGSLGSDFEEENVDLFSPFTELEKLVIWHFDILKNEHIDSLANCKKLKSLFFEGCLDNETFLRLPFEQFPSLRELSISDSSGECDITPESVEQKLRDCPELVGLRLNNMSLPDLGILSELPKLAYLNLNYCEIDNLYTIPGVVLKKLKCIFVSYSCNEEMIDFLRNRNSDLLIFEHGDVDHDNWIEIADMMILKDRLNKR